jgi:hypothetical protein
MFRVPTCEYVGSPFRPNPKKYVIQSEEWLRCDPPPTMTSGATVSSACDRLQSVENPTTSCTKYTYYELLVLRYLILARLVMTSTKEEGQPLRKLRELRKGWRPSSCRALQCLFGQSSEVSSVLDRDDSRAQCTAADDDCGQTHT